MQHYRQYQSLKSMWQHAASWKLSWQQPCLLQHVVALRRALRWPLLVPRLALCWVPPLALRLWLCRLDPQMPLRVFRVRRRPQCCPTGEVEEGRPRTRELVVADRWRRRWRRRWQYLACGGRLQRECCWHWCDRRLFCTAACDSRLFSTAAVQRFKFECK